MTVIFMMVMGMMATDMMDIAGRFMAIAVPQGMELGHPLRAARSTDPSLVSAVLRGITRWLAAVDFPVALWRLAAAHAWEGWGDLQGVPAEWQCVRVDSPGIPVGLVAYMAVAVADTAVVIASKSLPRPRQLSAPRRDAGLEV
jgi:sterol desaturase/sphingolipid hydroxylase (fatty acid hydroxylase superfamily)